MQVDKDDMNTELSADPVRQIADEVYDDVTRDEVENLGLAYVAIERLIQRLREAGLLIDGTGAAQ
jgi:hypothetical protein